MGNFPNLSFDSGSSNVHDRGTTRTISIGLIVGRPVAGTLEITISRLLMKASALRWTKANFPDVILQGIKGVMNQPSSFRHQSRSQQQRFVFCPHSIRTTASTTSFGSSILFPTRLLLSEEQFIIGHVDQQDEEK